MASRAIPGLLRFRRISTDNLIYHLTKNTVYRPSLLSYPLSRCINEYSTATSEEEKTQGESSTKSKETANETKLKAEIELLNKDIIELREYNNELENKYKRALADGENLRVRLMKQIEDAKIFGIQSFCKDLLDVADILGKATESVPKDEITEKNPHLKSLYEGLIMTEAQLHKVFTKHGLISLNPLDEKFDPNQHEALFQQV
ncbi:grpE protein homolog 1, mitochondrial isoform X2 [Prorops nasuta]|uniref:grpE protein homolog 1, mitochondrial isoform X2 n=1 Tax=Prorops nasuta TaxID=863751 RepID=UPI0034CF3861